jgi:hypothetical protein
LRWLHPASRDHDGPRARRDHRCDALFGVPDVTGLTFVLNARGRLTVVRRFGLVR